MTMSMLVANMDANGRSLGSPSTMETSVVRVKVAAGKTIYELCKINVGAVMGAVQFVPASAASSAPKTLHYFSPAETFHECVAAIG